MNWEYLISNSFLKSNNSLVRVSKLLSLLGMAVGSFSIIISLSIMNGFEDIVSNRLIGFEGDLRIFGNYDINELNKIDIIDDISPFIERNAIIEKFNEFTMATFKAIEPSKIENFYNIPFEGKPPKEGQAMIGQELAIRLGLNIGDSISIFSPIDQNFGFGLPKKKRMIVSAIFFSKVLDYDFRYVFITYEDGEKLFKKKKRQISSDIRISSDLDLNVIKENLILKLNRNVIIKSWSDLNESLVKAMKLEKIGAVIVLSLIFVVASFNLAMSLSLNSIQNLKEIGLLRSIGASKNSIKKIIIIMGIKLAGIGIFFGTIIAIMIILLQDKFGFIPIPSEVYFLDSLPMYINYINIILVISISLTFVFITSYISGKNISKISITKAFQWTK